MDTRQTQTMWATIVIVVLAILAVVGVIAERRQSSRLMSKASGKPFLAKQGTMREGAAIRTSSRKMDLPAGLTPSGGARPSREEMAEEEISPDVSETLPGSGADVTDETQEIVLAALNALDPGQGIIIIEENLAANPDSGAESRLYSALALLYMQRQPPEAGKALQAARKALELAQSAEDRQHAGIAEATVLMKTGDSAGAVSRIQAVIAQNAEITVPALQLRLMLGHIESERGDDRAAEEAYNAICQEAPALLASDPEAEGIYRQACLLLARIYRKAGREKDAGNVERVMKRRLAGLP